MVKEEETSNDYIVRMRGLPWAVTVDEVLKFLEGCNPKNGKEGVHLTMSREGRPSGEAFVEFDNEADFENAMKKDREHIGHRYIEVFKTTRSDMEWVVDRSGLNMENIMDESCVRLRGLPFGCTKEDVSNFFTGLQIVSNGITFVNDSSGRNTGEAYVQFVNKEMVEEALKKHLERIGHRYIEIFRSSLAEIRAQTGPKIRPLMSESISRPMPYDRGDRFGGMNRFGRGGPPPRRGAYDDDDDWDAPPPFRGRGMSPPPAMRMRNSMFDNGNSGGNAWKRDQGFMIHMRGLPYRSTEQDIATFFKPLVPVDIQLLYERSGLPSGEADVEFATFEDAQEAMLKDKANIKNRYIELFLTSAPPRKRVPSRPTSNMGDAGVGGGDVQNLFSRRGPVGPGPGVGPMSSAYDDYYDTAPPFKGGLNSSMGGIGGSDYRPGGMGVPRY